MISIYLKFVIPIFLLCFNISTNKNYIRLYYGGIVDKPIPEVILYRDTYFTDVYFFGIKENVPNRNLALIQKEIVTNPFYKQADTSRSGYYNIEIHAGDNIFQYTVADKNSALILFKLVVNKIDDFEVKKSLRSFFEDIATRIP